MSERLIAAVTPVRIKRTKGWRMPENTVYVGRPTKWGNPFVMHHPNGPRHLRKPMTPENAVAAFRSMIEKESGWFPVPLPWPKGKIPAQFTTIEDVRELRGKNLACWCGLCERHQDGLPLGEHCSDCDPCHADVLLELANASPERGPA